MRYLATRARYSFFVRRCANVISEEKRKMSFFAKVFSSKKSQAPLTPTEAIQKLRDMEAMLEKKTEFLDAKIQQERATAVKAGTKNKRAAIQALKRKKRYEKQQQQIDNVLTTIEMQREALESASTNTAVLQTMKTAADALKVEHQHMDVDKIHDIMDEISEQQEVAREISDAISNPATFGQDIDEDDLQRELDELMQEDLDRELLGIDTNRLPAVPTGKLPSLPNRKEKEEDDDLRELAQWAT